MAAHLGQGLEAGVGADQEERLVLGHIAEVVGLKRGREHGGGSVLEEVPAKGA